MLRDLEQRKPSKIQPGQPLRIQLPQQQRNSGKYAKWVWMILIAGVAGFLFYPFSSRQDTSIAADKPKVPATSSPITRQAVVDQVDKQPQPTLAQTSANSTSEPAPAPPLIQATSPTPTLSATEAVNTHQPTNKSTTKANSTSQLAAKSKPLASESSEKNTKALYRQAQNSASLLMRKETLKDLLELDPQDLPARNLLLQTLLKSNAPGELDTFLQESLQLYPNHLAFITTQAHLQMQRKQFAAAIATLERVDSSQINEPTYLSLLAAGYQQQHQYQNAANVYQKLTQLQPDRAEHWLGLGICAEQLHHNQTAVMAYRQALAKNTLSSQVVDYIKQRLSSLN
jgi:MSHA biogenesis protein MshN